MALVYAAVAPHGSQAVPALAGGDAAQFGETAAGLRAIAEGLRNAAPDTVVVATPHGFRIERMISISTASYAAGEVADNGAAVSVRAEGDPGFARKWLTASQQRGIPAAGVTFGTAEGEASVLPLDWGVVIPWWFLADAGVRPRLVVVTPTRDVGLEPLVKLGTLLAEIAEADTRRVAFIASADQAHAHDVNGPYGYAPEAKQFDEAVVEAVRADDLERILSFDAEFVDRAKPDSLWQMAILCGVLRRVPMRGTFLSYQAPTYFGMLCAYWSPREGVAGA
ncbi:MAG: extradiol ring-cleavage dioxygenase [Thermoflavifilum sp.]|nr:extradiol ring-cleavage dioxygenase [Thermoflavifilum sp.]MCL6514609.1 hypothetical protein [Alicyclobacillus sp.]